LILKLLMQTCKSINFQVLIKFWQNWFKQEGKHYGTRSINSLNLFAVMENCLISRRSILFYQFTRRAVELVLVIFKEYRSYQVDKKLSNIFLSRLSP
jgi:hypothetical protein